MPSRPDIGFALAWCGKTQRMPYLASRDLLLADETGKYRQPRCIRARPAVVAQFVAFEVEASCRHRVPGAVRVGDALVKLEQGAAALLHHDDVPVVTASGTALDRSVARDRMDRGRLLAHLPLVTEIAKVNRNLRLVHGNDHERNADRCAVVFAGAEIGVQVLARPDARDVLLRARVERQLVDRRVPNVVGRKGGATTCGRAGCLGERIRSLAQKERYPNKNR